MEKRKTDEQEDKKIVFIVICLAQSAYQTIKLSVCNGRFIDLNRLNMEKWNIGDVPSVRFHPYTNSKSVVAEF